ncbi:MAG TPA: O-antigen ligase family protein [Rhodothermales bacterium]
MRVLTTIAHEASVLDAVMTMAAAVLRPLFLVAVVIYVAQAAADADRRAWIGKAFASVGTFEAVFSLLMFVIPVPGIGVREGLWYESLAGCGLRITGTLGLSANHIGAVFVVAIPVTIGVAISTAGRARYAWAAAAAVQAAALVFTFTRASILLGLVAGGLVLVYYLRVQLAAVATLVLIVVLGAVSSYACTPAPTTPPGPSQSPFNSPSATPSTPGASPTALQSPGAGEGIIDRFADPSDRLALWYAAFRITMDNPLLGVGIGNMVGVVRGDPQRYGNTPYGKATNSAHNTILLAGAETGVLGALGTLVINVVIALGALEACLFRRRYPLAVAAGIASLAFLAQGMVNNLFTVPATGTLLAILVGIIVATPGGPPPMAVRNDIVPRPS